MRLKMFLTGGAVVALSLAAATLQTWPQQARAEETVAAKSEGKWAEHTGDLPFVIGYDKGMKQVEMTGKPPMYFFTTTW